MNVFLGSSVSYLPPKWTTSPAHKPPSWFWWSDHGNRTALFWPRLASLIRIVVVLIIAPHWSPIDGQAWQIMYTMPLAFEVWPGHLFDQAGAGRGICFWANDDGNNGAILARWRRCAIDTTTGRVQEKVEGQFSLSVGSYPQFSPNDQGAEMENHDRRRALGFRSIYWSCFWALKRGKVRCMSSIDALRGSFKERHGTNSLSFGCLAIGSFVCYAWT